MSTTLHSSGTTGTPKTYTLTPAQIAARVADVARVRPPGWANLTTLYNDYADRPGVHRDTAWMAEKGGKLFRPLATFDATIKQFIDNNIQGVFGPARGLLRFAAALATTAYRPTIVASSTTLLTPEMSKSIRAGIGDNLWNIYSAGECGTIAMATAAEVEATYGCVGKPIAGVQVQIVNGEIQVKTPIMIPGYDDPKLTAAKFVNGWFLTGDRGSLAADGTLIYEGRV
jgi:long-subunit acyl-CoA synthetase (AMP-forming)